MGICCKLVGAAVAALAVVVGLLTSGHLSRWGAIKKLDEVMMQNGKYYFVGMTPSSYPDGKLPFNFEDIPSLKGKTAMVTGANIGLGLETARHLAINGARVFIHCRSQKKCDNAKASIDASLPKGATPVETAIADLSDLKAVAKMADAVLAAAPELHILVLNAGVPWPGDYAETTDGIEITFGINHLSHFLLFNRLRPALEAAAEKAIVRVVSVSSAGHYDPYPDSDMYSSLAAINNASRYNSKKRYGLTKQHNVMFAFEIAERTGPNIVATACHPGGVDTNIWEKLNVSLHDWLPAWAASACFAAVNNLRKQAMWTSEQGALTQLFLATKSEPKDNGKYFHPVAREMPPNPLSFDTKRREDLWNLSTQLLKERNLI